MSTRDAFLYLIVVMVIVFGGVFALHSWARNRAKRNQSPPREEKP